MRLNRRKVPYVFFRLWGRERDNTRDKAEETWSACGVFKLVINDRFQTVESCGVFKRPWRWATSVIVEAQVRVRARPGGVVDPLRRLERRMASQTVKLVIDNRVSNSDTRN